MNFILIAVIVPGAIGLPSCRLVLFASSKRSLLVYEDPRIAQVNELLPGANCRLLRLYRMRGMADALVKVLMQELWKVCSAPWVELIHDVQGGQTSSVWLLPTARRKWP